ncbi:M24 family metallopeptidase [Massilia sp. TS11]|uniref:M24 family metallopeptidase n=1 Tax=Massilia sp. TS11 TaxID=2908003 RepID=UPI001ED9F759|nr:M24 family metallopeptidase [Massilia sp. TS11]MCG2583751.1 aminopeptidase P family protein [Massilia sp. TS11]
MKALALAVLLAFGASASAQVLPLREQARVINEVLAERMETVLPGLMERSGIDMWILVSREYNEDPVLRTMLPAEWLSARRRTILVFYRDPASGKMERMAVARYNVGTAIQAAWDPEKQPDQWQALASIVAARQPRKIGINVSRDFAHADGLDHTDHEELLRALPAEARKRVVSAEPLAVGWLETRTAREMAIFAQMVNATHKIIEQGFSEQVITPGVTTTEDVEWWFRETIRARGYDTWFHPTVSVQRDDKAQFDHLTAFSNRPKANVIQPGDLLHVDIGISYLRLNTDVQQHAYVLRPGETRAPESLVKAFGAANRLQDILRGQFGTGRSGNQILSAALQQARSEGIGATIYTHPIGYHGHAAGPTIGMWDMQQGVPGSGDYAMRPHTAYSIELNAQSQVPDWGKAIRIMLEEDAYFDGSATRFIGGRQQQLYTIPRAMPAIGD